ncbi:MAG TPA: arginine--tRNA ligase [Candidatus Saccharimonadales bacterium]|nr:arginine--tRNA ligase [Candidatus Saccharimonadales bacterium]
MKQELEAALAGCAQELFDAQVPVELTRPDEKFGDYATNVALQLAKQAGKPPREIADALAAKAKEKLGGKVSDVSVAEPGFLNLRLSDEALVSSMSTELTKSNEGRKVLLEYSCPNAFKELHTGHLYTTIAGDVLGRLLEASGAIVFRANFGGDVGLHVAKCLYGVVQEIGGEYPDKLKDIPKASRPEWVSAAYVAGAKAYEEDETAKAKITDINSQVYGFHESNDKTSGLAKIYWVCREWSYDYFKDFYEKIEVEPFDKYYPESSTIEPGSAVVNKHTGTVFEKSDGALIYRGQEAGLHTRVFVTSKGLPTYETKDLGVIFTEANDFAYDKRVLITGNDQTDYMKVVFAALGAIDRDLAAKQTHLTNGTVRFGSGQKMSSRLGNVSRAVDVIQTVNDTLASQNPGSDHYTTALAAIKYTFLKHRLGGDIAFDIDESVSLEGNSGPYLQYAHARARSILRKAGGEGGKIDSLEAGERTLARKISEFTEVVDKAVAELMPHYVCTYLYELAQIFNRFYENNRVIGDQRQDLRLVLVQKYADTLQAGLNLVGIASPDKM